MTFDNHVDTWQICSLLIYARNSSTSIILISNVFEILFDFSHEESEELAIFYPETGIFSAFKQVQQTKYIACQRYLRYDQKLPYHLDSIDLSVTERRWKWEEENGEVRT